MILKRLYDERIAQAAYLVGCQRTREAVVIDPNRNFDPILRAAATENLKVTYVTETHIHADFVSGARELAAFTGARLALSAEGGDGWHYKYAVESNALLLSDGDVLTIGDVELRVVHTPGHTPEHLTFMVTDLGTSREPIGALTGDFVFVGDVGRPDLLERAAGETGTMAAAAAQLFRSLRRFAAYPDYLQIWPGHGAGSACGKSLGAMPQSTLGYEKLANWAFNSPSEAEFVTEVTSGQPDPPLYFSRMKQVNRDSPPLSASTPTLPEMTPAEVDAFILSGGTAIDLRSADSYASGHIRGAVSIPINKSFTGWAGSVIGFDRDIILLASDDSSGVTAAVVALGLIGLDHIIGRGDASRGRTPLDNVEIQDVGSRSESARILDVRTATEWINGHIPGSLNIPLQRLRERIDELDPATPLIVHCQGGTRSAIAASLLEANGFRTVANMSAGFGGWSKAGMPVEGSS